MGKKLFIEYGSLRIDSLKERCHINTRNTKALYHIHSGGFMLKFGSKYG